MNAVKSVLFNAGENQKNQFAIVVAEKGDTKLDLAVLTESGVHMVSDVPHREPADYDANGGGHTWHTKHTT